MWKQAISVFENRIAQLRQYGPTRDCVSPSVETQEHRNVSLNSLANLQIGLALAKLMVVQSVPPWMQNGCATQEPTQRMRIGSPTGRDSPPLVLGR